MQNRYLYLKRRCWPLSDTIIIGSDRWSECKLGKIDSVRSGWCVRVGLGYGFGLGLDLRSWLLTHSWRSDAINFLLAYCQIADLTLLPFYPIWAAWADWWLDKWLELDNKENSAYFTNFDAPISMGYPNRLRLTIYLFDNKNARLSKRATWLRFDNYRTFTTVVQIRGVRVHPYPWVYPTRPVPARTGRVG